jgi:hypothetical protein
MYGCVNGGRIEDSIQKVENEKKQANRLSFRLLCFSDPDLEFAAS